MDMEDTEMMAQLDQATFDEAVQSLNNAKLSVDASSKIDQLKSLVELVVKKSPQLLPEFLSGVLEFHLDSAAAVRKYLPDFIDAAVAAVPTPQVLSQCLACLDALIKDTASAVSKRAITSCYPTFRSALVLVAITASRTEDAQSLKSLWSSAEAVKLSVVQAVSSPDSNSSARVAAVKFVEQCCLLLTADKLPAVTGLLDVPSPHPGDNQVVTRANMARDSEQLAATLVGLLKLEPGSEVSVPLAIVCIKAARTIAQQRPQFLGRLMPAIISLASKTNDEPIKQALKEVLASLSKLQHPMAAPWKKKVQGAIAALDGVHEDAAVNQPSKRQRMESEEHQLPFQMKPEPAPDAHEDTIGGAPSNHQYIVEDARAVVASQDGTRIASFIRSLSPVDLADVVLATLSGLPPRHAVSSGTVYYEPWMHQMVGLLAQDSSLPDNWMTLFATLPSDPRLAAPKQEVEPLTQQPIKESAPAAVRPVKAAPAVAAFSTVPAPMVEQLQYKLRMHAVLRMLNSGAGGNQVLKRSVMARLLASVPSEDNIVEQALNTILKDFQKADGFEIVMSWLYALFVEHAEMPQSVNTSPTYETVLMHVLTGLKSSLPPQDRTIAKVLVEVPLLPMPAVQQYIEELCHAGPEWSTLALVCARDIILGRPVDRQVIMDVVLKSCVSMNSELRGKAVRLVANRLFLEPYLQGHIQEYATDAIKAVATEEAMQDALNKLGVANVPGDANDEEEKEGPEDQAAALSALFCALCTKKHSLLRTLFETYGQCQVAGKTAIEHNVPGLAKTLGPSVNVVLDIVHSPPAGSLDLVLQFLYVYSEAAVGLPPPLVAASLQVYETSKDPRVLAPIVANIDRGTVLNKLPALLELPQDVLKATVQRLTKARTFPPAEQGGQGVTVPAPFTPSEILTALHTVSGDASVLKRAMLGITVCLSSPELFNHEALASTINQLMTRVPLPPLFMRTVIQSLAAAPQLKTFVVGVMSQLASRQIWRDATQWKGWVMCAKQTAPDCFPLLLQLPASALQDVLTLLAKDDVKSQLAAYATSQTTSVIPQEVLQLLNG